MKTVFIIQTRGYYNPKRCMNTSIRTLNRTFQYLHSKIYQPFYIPREALLSICIIFTVIRTVRGVIFVRGVITEWVPVKVSDIALCDAHNTRAILRTDFHWITSVDYFLVPEPRFAPTLRFLLLFLRPPSYRKHVRPDADW